MRALSIKQPWAWLIVNGYKGVENRTWNTKHRGDFYIHASKQFDQEGYEWVKKNFPKIPLPEKAQFMRGGIVGRSSIINVVYFTEKRLLTTPDKDWFFGPYGFILSEAEEMAFVPCKGKLGFFAPDINN